MLVVSAGPLLTSLDASIVNVALPVMAAQFRASASATVWVATAYQLAAVVFLLPFAALGERIGCRRVYLGGLAVFGLASLGCALAPNLPALVGFRILQGIGGAGTGAVSMALVRFIYPHARLGRGVALFGLVANVGVAAGPTAAAAILSVATWPWLFLVNLPVVVMALALARLTPDSPHRPAPFDYAGAVFTGLALLLLVLGVGSLEGEAAAQGLAMIVAGLGLGAALLKLQARRAHPIVPVDLLANRLLSLSALTAVCTYAAQSAAMVAAPFLVHDLMGRGPAVTGLLMTPWPLLIVAMAPIAGRLADRVPAGAMSSVGLSILIAGLLWAHRLGAGSGDLEVALVMALCGLGVGFFHAPNNRVLLASAPRHRAGSANGIIALARLSGQTLGSAGAAVCLAWYGHAGVGPGLLMAAGLAAAGLCLGAARLGRWTKAA